MQTTSILRNTGTTVPQNTEPATVLFVTTMFFYSEMDLSGKSKIPVGILWLPEIVETKSPCEEFVFLSFVLGF